MLVLMRKALNGEPGDEQKLTIGDDIEITVLSINGNQVKLGIKAPDSVRIRRNNLVNK